jgi:uncharacterized protein (TIGR03437 family)
VTVVLVAGSPASGISQISSDGRRAAATATAACSPTALVPVFTQLPSSFTVAAGFPGQVAVKVVDDCGTPMTAGEVVSSYSNGDPPQRLISLKDGNWAATWTPERVVSPVTVTVNAAIPDQNLKGTAQVTGSFNSTDPTPILGAGAVLNGASFVPQSPISPGSFITLFGSQLAQGSSSAEKVPLPTTLAEATVLIAGRESPMIYASDGQVNAMVPYGIPVNTTHQVIVLRGTSISVPQSITVAPAAPGIFARDGTGQGQGIILGVLDSGDQIYADSANPVHSGQNIVIYCTGLGEVDPAVKAGDPTPLDHLTNAVNPVDVTIGGIKVRARFAGLTPGSTGLYQVNAIVPEGVAPGNAVPVFLTSAGQASAQVTIAVH